MSSIEAIQQALDAVAEGHDALASVSVFESLPSTNTWLAGQPPPPVGRAHAAMTLHQTEGRGQHGRRWLAPAGSGLCLSVAFRFARMPKNASALTLAVGVAVQGAVAALGASAAKLKWPNDLVCGDEKLGGILVESSTLTDQSFLVVVGIGINLDLPDAFSLGDAGGWARGATDLRQQGMETSLEALAEPVLLAVLGTLETFEHCDLDAVMTRYNAVHWLQDQMVQVDGRRARCGAVDATGRLSLRDAVTGEMTWLSSGEPVPIRLAS